MYIVEKLKNKGLEVRFMIENRDILTYDVCILGAGPAGLAAAYHLKSLDHDQNLQICVLEKAADIGGHSLSGACMETSGLDQLIPNWQEENKLNFTKVTKHTFVKLTKTDAKYRPTPPQLKSGKQVFVHQSELVRYLAEKCEAIGVEVFPGFSAQTPLIENNQVIGVRTGNFGEDKQGNPTERFVSGPDIRAKVTLVADGCRGHITKQLVAAFNLENPLSAQSYGIGLKEIWRTETPLEEGALMHSMGWPLDNETYGGGFLYQMADNLISLGFIVGLDYKDPDLQPHRMLQRFKTHPKIAHLLKDATLISSGARSIYESGLNGQYKLSMPGALLVGDAAGTLNIAKLKGIHTAIKSGIIAAKTTYLHLTKGTTLEQYEEDFKNSNVYNELHKVRNIRAWFTKGTTYSILGAGLETVTFGKLPYNLKMHPDHQALKKFRSFKPESFTPNPQSLSRLDALEKSFIQHNEEQPNHIQIIDPNICMTTCADEYNHPCLNFCPAQVFELVDDPDTEKGSRIQVNSANCIHCKTCDIKDPYQVINWVAPEGGSGPNYTKA